MSAPSSSSEARTEPPSDSRIAEARAQGHVPRAEFVGLAVIWLILVGAFAFLSLGLIDVVQTMLRAPLQSIADGVTPSIAELPFVVFRRVGVTWAGVLLLCMISALLARAVAQGFTFRVGQPVRAKRFAPVVRTRWLSACLLALVAAVVFACAMPDVLRAEVASLVPTLLRFAFRLAAVLVLVAIVDVLLARTAWWRSLWMTRHQRRLEEREAHGTPELRSARDRLRHESRTEWLLRSRP